MGASDVHLNHLAIASCYCQLDRPIAIVATFLTGLLLVITMTRSGFRRRREYRHPLRGKHTSSEPTCSRSLLVRRHLNLLYGWSLMSMLTHNVIDTHTVLCIVSTGPDRREGSALRLALDSLRSVAVWMPGLREGDCTGLTHWRTRLSPPRAVYHGALRRRPDRRLSTVG